MSKERGSISAWELAAAEGTEASKWSASDSHSTAGTGSGSFASAGGGGSGTGESRGSGPSPSVSSPSSSSPKPSSAAASPSSDWGSMASSDVLSVRGAGGPSGLWEDGGSCVMGVDAPRRSVLKRSRFTRFRWPEGVVLVRTLVTGATGLIGANLVRRLARDGARVRVLLPPGAEKRALAGVDAEAAAGDVRDAHSLEKAMLGISRVYHAAGRIRF